MGVQSRISDYIRDMGIKHSSIADRSGIPRWAINGIVNGKRKMTANEFELICKAIDKQPNDFMEWDQ